MADEQAAAESMRISETVQRLLRQAEPGSAVQDTEIAAELDEPVDHVARTLWSMADTYLMVRPGERGEGSAAVSSAQPHNP